MATFNLANRDDEEKRRLTLAGQATQSLRGIAQPKPQTTLRVEQPTIRLSQPKTVQQPTLAQSALKSVSQQSPVIRFNQPQKPRLVNQQPRQFTRQDISSYTDKTGSLASDTRRVLGNVGKGLLGFGKNIVVQPARGAFRSLTGVSQKQERNLEQAKSNLEQKIMLAQQYYNTGRIDGKQLLEIADKLELEANELGLEELQFSKDSSINPFDDLRDVAVSALRDVARAPANVISSVTGETYYPEKNRAVELIYGREPIQGVGSVARQLGAETPLGAAFIGSALTALDAVPGDPTDFVSTTTKSITKDALTDLRNIVDETDSTVIKKYLDNTDSFKYLTEEQRLRIADLASLADNEKKLGNLVKVVEQEVGKNIELNSKTRLTIPEEGVYARIPDTIFARLVDETSNIKFDKEKVHLDNVDSIAKGDGKYVEVPFEEVVRRSDELKQSLSELGESITPTSVVDDIVQKAEQGTLTPADVAPQRVASDISRTADDANLPASIEPDDLQRAGAKIFEEERYLQSLQRQVAREQSRARGKKIAAAERAAIGKEGVEALNAKLTALKGGLSNTKQTGLQLSGAELDELINAIEASDKFRPFEKINLQTAVRNLSEGKPPRQFELKLFKRAFGQEVVGIIEDATPSPSMLSQVLLQAINTPRALMSTLDFSASLRQGLLMATGFPKVFAKNFFEQFKFWGSESYFKAAMEDIQTRPTAQLMADSGLQLSGLDDVGLSAREEAFMASWLEDVPGAGRAIRASERAYTGLLNKMRADVFDTLIEKAQDSGIDIAASPQVAKDVAKFVNAASGRGDLGKLNKAVPLLNGLFFSPRLIAARVNMLNPAFYAQLDPFARKQAAKAMLSLGTTAMTVLTLAELAGAEVEKDPRSSDFGKIKIGNTRYDILGGFQQYIRASAQIVTGVRKAASSGNVSKLDGSTGGDSRLDIVIDFIRGKSAPIPSLAFNALDGENMVGEEFDLGKETLERVTPLIVQDIYQVATEEGLIEAIPVTAANTFGIGTTTFPDKTSTGAELPSGGDESLRDLAEFAKAKDEEPTFIDVAPEKLRILDGMSEPERREAVKKGLATKEDLANLEALREAERTRSGQNEITDFPKGLGKDERTIIQTNANIVDSDGEGFRSRNFDYAQRITKKANNEKPKGIPDFKSSNGFALDYARAKEDIINADNSYDKQSIARNFWKDQHIDRQPDDVSSLFRAAQSSDQSVRQAIERGDVTKKDLEKAIKLDDQLYNAGLQSYLAFGKTLRSDLGYSMPDSYTKSSGGSGGSGSSRVFIPTVNRTGIFTAGDIPTVTTQPKSQFNFKTTPIQGAPSDRKPVVRLER